MIISAIIIILSAIITVFMCKSVASNFDKREQILIEKEQRLYAEQAELRDIRRDLKRKLADLKNSAKEKKPAAQPSTVESIKIDLKEWLEGKQSLETNQYATASKFANERNMNILSALLTLDMITVKTYEEAKKLNLKM